MKLRFNYIDNEIKVDNDYINVIEIENKSYFFRTVNNLLMTTNSNMVEELTFFDENYKELNMFNKFNIIIDYFNIDFNTKRNMTFMTKKISENIPELDKVELNNVYNKMIKIFKKYINNFDIDISVSEEFNINDLIKLFKLEINKKDNLLDNLLLLIDIEKEFCLDQILIFINLKQYLNTIELVELYKYSIYNNVKILIIDSQNYGTTLDYEKKLIIDSNLDEFVL